MNNILRKYKIFILFPEQENEYKMFFEHISYITTELKKVIINDFPNSIFYFKGNECIFEYNLRYNTIHMKYSNLCECLNMINQDVYPIFDELIFNYFKTYHCLKLANFVKAPLSDSSEIIEEKYKKIMI